MQFAVGEALVFAYGGLPLTFEAVLHSHFLTLADCPQLAEKAHSTTGAGGSRVGFTLDFAPGFGAVGFPRSGD